jgi:hypothetical protein
MRATQFLSPLPLTASLLGPGLYLRATDEASLAIPKGYVSDGTEYVQKTGQSVWNMLIKGV